MLPGTQLLPVISAIERPHNPVDGGQGADCAQMLQTTVPAAGQEASSFAMLLGQSLAAAPAHSLSAARLASADTSMPWAEVPPVPTGAAGASMLQTAGIASLTPTPGSDAWPGSGQLPAKAAGEVPGERQLPVSAGGSQLPHDGQSLPPIALSGLPQGDTHALQSPFAIASHQGAAAETPAAGADAGSITASVAALLPGFEQAVARSGAASTPAPNLAVNSGQAALADTVPAGPSADSPAGRGPMPIPVDAAERWQGSAGQSASNSEQAPVSAHAAEPGPQRSTPVPASGQLQQFSQTLAEREVGSRDISHGLSQNLAQNLPQSHSQNPSQNLSQSLSHNLTQNLSADLPADPAFRLPSDLSQSVASTGTASAEETLSPASRSEPAGTAIASQPGSSPQRGTATPAAAMPFAQTLGQVFDQPQWGEGFARHIALLTGQRVGQAELRLDPPELGSLLVRINVSGDQASISFVSQHAVVRDAIEQNFERLQELLKEQGLGLSDLDVSDQSTDQHNRGDDVATQPGEVPMEDGNPVEEAAVQGVGLLDTYV